MANSESQFRREIVASAKAFGAHAFSINDQFLIGHPDVYAAMDCKSYWLELKFIHSETVKTSWPLKLTAPQRAFLKAEQDVGCCAGWVLCVKNYKLKCWDVYAGSDSSALVAEPINFIERKLRGQELIWEIPNILHRISLGF